MVHLFLRNFLLSIALVCLGWFYVQLPASVGVASFLAFLQDTTTAMLVIGATAALAVIEWFS